MSLSRSLLTGFLVVTNGIASASAYVFPRINVTACNSAPYQLQGSPVAIEDATSTHTISLLANCGQSWNVAPTADVTTWFLDCDDNPIFTSNESVAQATSVNGSLLTISLDSSKIASFTTNGPGTLAVRPTTGTLGTSELPNTYVGKYTVPTLNIVSTIQGSAYTHAKSTLKYSYGVEVEYDPNTSATVYLDLPGLDNSMVESSNATVTLVPGDGYYTTEYILNATSLTEPFNNGMTSYQLAQGDLVLNEGGYLTTDKDSGREWSCLGGDGQGSYVFNLEVAGITYKGLPVAAQRFPIHIYIHGYNYGYNITSDADVKYGNGTVVEPDFAPLSSKTSTPPTATASPIFTWIGAGNKPNLVDSLPDDFYITWPTAADASQLEACDVVIVLYSRFGKTLQLEAGQDFVLETSTSETQIAVTYSNWPFEPVWTTMTITVEKSELAASARYDIVSQYSYLAQQGGGGTQIDGTVTAYSFYGIANLTTPDQIATPANYTLNATVDGVQYYYAESASGAGTLVSTLADATTFDGNGVEDHNLEFIGNTLYVTTRINATATKTVSNASITFEKEYLGGATLTPDQVRSYLHGEPGFVLPPGLDGAELAGVDADESNNTWIYHEKWAWQPKIAIGFHGIDITPYTGKFEWTLDAGASQQFTASTWPGFDEGAAASVTWSIFGNTSSTTSISDEGLLTFGSDETATSVAVIATSNVDKSYNGIGTVNVIVATSSS